MNTNPVDRPVDACVSTATGPSCAAGVCCEKVDGPDPRHMFNDPRSKAAIGSTVIALRDFFRPCRKDRDRQVLWGDCDAKAEIARTSRRPGKKRCRHFREGVISRRTVYQCVERWIAKPTVGRAFKPDSRLETLTRCALPGFISKCKLVAQPLFRF